MSSYADKIGRNRKPRVHIAVEHDTGGVVEERELPFVVGVMGDFTGNNAWKETARYKDRKFTQVDPDNFDNVMNNLAPGLSYRVDNKLADDNSEMAVELKFGTMDDFEPARVAEQVPALKKLMETRNKLRDLLTKVDKSEELEGLLESVLQNADDLANLSQELGLEAGGSSDGDD